MIIEVFKTNIEDAGDARLLVDRIKAIFPDCYANFDLSDCDHILRVVGASGTVMVSAIIDLVENLGYVAEVLNDDL